MPSALLEKQLILFGLDWQQLNRGDAERLQVGQGSGVGEPCICPAQFRRQPRRVRCEAFDMQLVDDGFAPRHVGVGGLAFVLGGVSVVDGDGYRHAAEGVKCAHVAVGGSVDDPVVDGALVGECGGIEFHGPVNAFAIRVKQDFMRVEAHVVCWIPLPVHAIGVAHAVPSLGQVDIPQAVVRTAHCEQGFAHVHGFDDARADGEEPHFLRPWDGGPLEQANCFVVEGGRAVKRFVDAQPDTVGCF